MLRQLAYPAVRGKPADGEGTTCLSDFLPEDYWLIELLAPLRVLSFQPVHAVY